MVVYTHRSAVDDTNTGMSTTYCGLYYPMDSGAISNDPTCSVCKEQLLKDRKARGSARVDDPEWVKKEVINFDLISDEELQCELARRAHRAKQEAIPRPRPTESIDWSDLIRCCDDITKKIAEDEFDDEDNKHWIYEAVIRAIYGKEYWTWRNKIC